MYGPAAEPERARGPNPLLYVMIALVLVLAGVAVWLVVTWVQARDDRAAATEAQARASAELARLENDNSIERSRARDEVTRVAETGVAAFHTLDYRRVDEGLDAWEKASTGPLHDEVARRREQSKQSIEAAKTVTSGKVLSLAVIDLNESAGTATVIAAVEVTVTPEGKQQDTKYLRIQGSLQRTGAGWKLSAIGPVDFARN